MGHGVATPTRAVLMPGAFDVRHSSVSTTGLADGLGRRTVRFDREIGAALECLLVRPELSAYEDALRRQAAAIAALDDERLVRVRAVEREGTRLVVTSELVIGDRLLDVIDARGAGDAAVSGLDAAFGFLLQILPALSRLHGAGLVHGTLSAARVTLTGTAQVVVGDAIFGAVLPRLHLSRHRLWTEFQIAAPRAAGVVRFDATADVTQASLIALMLTLGRPVEASDPIDALPGLVSEAVEVAQIRGGDELAEAVRKFFTTTLPLDGIHTGVTADQAAKDAGAIASGALGDDACVSALAEFVRYEAPAAPVPVPRPASVHKFPPPVPVAVERVHPVPVAVESVHVYIEEPEVEVALDLEVAAPVAPEVDVPTETYAAKDPWTWSPSSTRAPEPESPAFDAVVPEPVWSAPAVVPEVVPSLPVVIPEPVAPIAPAPVAVVPEPVAPAPAVVPEPVPAAPVYVAPEPVRSEPVVQRPVVPEPVAPPPPIAVEAPRAPIIPTAAVPLIDRRDAEFVYEPPPAPIVPLTPKVQAPYVPPQLPLVGPAMQPPAAAYVPPPEYRTPPPPSPPAPRFVSPPVAPAAAYAPVATPAPLRLKQEAPAGFAPQRAHSGHVHQMDYQAPISTRGDEPVAFPKKLAVALVVITIGAIIGGKIYMQQEATKAEGPKPVPAKVTEKRQIANPVTESATGVLAITSIPSGAKVLLNGTAAGETPLRLDGLPPGRHTITLSTDSTTVKRTVKVEAGKELTLDIPVFSGWVAIFAPIVLDVAEGTRGLGSTENGRIMLPPGRHVLTVSNRQLGYSAIHTVEIGAGEEARLNLTPTGMVSVNAQPWAEVWLDGTKVGETPIANLEVPLGTREFVFRHPQHGERKVTVTVTASPATNISVDFTKNPGH